jgi:hypothetical protein
MRILIVQVATIFLVAASAGAVEDVDVSALVSQSLKTYNQLEKIMGRMKAATSDLDERLRPLRTQIRLFKQPVPDDERLRSINSNIMFFRNQIDTRQAYIEAAKITDPKERARLVDKYETDRKRILEEELDAGKPFGKRIDKLKKEFKDKQKSFDKAMKAYCLLPRSKYPTIAGTYVSTPFHTGRLTYKWRDSNNKQIAFAWISLKDKPVIKDKAEMLDNKFYISSHWANRIEVWAGHFHVNFNSTKQEMWGKEQIIELIKDFIDLDGLAKIDPTRSDSSLNALAMASLACSKRYHRISRERSDATSWLTAERVKVKNLKSRFKKPPADSEQLAEDKRLRDHYRKELGASQKRLEIGLVTDLNERRARIVKLEAEKKKLDAEKKKITRPFDDKTKELKRGLREKEAALNQALKKYFLRGGNAYPGVVEMSTETTFYKGRTSCNWKDADGNELFYAQVNLRNRPVIPKDARMLDGIYYISDMGTNFIWVWVGNCQVYFDVRKSQWRGKEDIGDAIKHFIDLDGLAKIN